MVKIILTMGDPAGVGPELCVRAAALPEFKGVPLVSRKCNFNCFPLFF